MTKLELPALPYAFDALEPHIDAQTMTIHHDKHHQAYIDNANKALEGTAMENMSADEIITSRSVKPACARRALIAPAASL